MFQRLIRWLRRRPTYAYSFDDWCEETSIAYAKECAARTGRAM